MFKYDVQDDSGMKRELCKSCGTPPFITSARFSDIQMFTVNTLDNSDIVSPSFKIWTQSKVQEAVSEPDITSFSHGVKDIVPK